MTDRYREVFYKSPDGLDLYARDYGDAHAQHTLLCMHGLTRNSADFHDLALHCKDRYRIISVDQRGRGKSAYYSNRENYRPDIYCQDMFALIAHLSLNNIIAVGTSMGGLMAMLMSVMRPGVFEAVIMNDVGPELDEAGVERIRGYVGGDGVFDSWDAAVKAIKTVQGDVFPKYTQADWLAFAKRTCEPMNNGRVRLAYDPAIKEGLKKEATTAVPPDLWPMWRSFGDTPVLVIRGAISDILSKTTLKKMQAELPNCCSVEIPDIGHAPMLDEPESLAAIDTFLEQFDGE